MPHKRVSKHTLLDTVGQVVNKLCIFDCHCLPGLVYLHIASIWARLLQQASRSLVWAFILNSVGSLSFYYFGWPVLTVLRLVLLDVMVLGEQNFTESDPLDDVFRDVTDLFAVK